MSIPYLPEKDANIAEVLSAYELPETFVGAVRYGQGHINDTFCILCQPQEGDCIRFILQGLSSAAFPKPDELMENFTTLLDAVIKAKPAAAKGQYIRSCVVTATMGPGVKINPNKVGSAAAEVK